jgi:type III secretion protein L
MAELIPPAQAAARAARALVSPAAPRVLSPSQAQALDEAQAVLALAQRALDEAHAQAAQLRAEAVEQGRAESQRELAAALLQARAEYDRLMARAEPDVVALALELTRRLVGRALDEDPTVLAELLAQVLPAVQHRRQLVVRLHPGDWEVLEAARPRLEALHGRALRWEVLDTVPRGACWLDTEAGRVEVSLQAQLAALAEALQTPSDGGAP